MRPPISTLDELAHLTLEVEPGTKPHRRAATPVARRSQAGRYLTRTPRRTRPAVRLRGRTARLKD